jgi:hypothetical protein
MILPKQDLNIPANLKQFALDVQSVAPAAVETDKAAHGGNRAKHNASRGAGL